MKFNYWKAGLITLGCVLIVGQTTGQAFQNLHTTFDQSGQMMQISYDLKHINFKKQVRIQPFLEWENGATMPLQSLSGDYGWLRRGGKNKLICWDPFKDGLDSLSGFEIKLETQIRGAAPPRFWGLALHGSNSAPIGLKLMQLRKVGFYAAVRTGRMPPRYQYAVRDSGALVDYRDSSVYKITDKRKLAGYAITIGQVLQLSRNMYAYAGLGYGAEELFWQYESFDTSKKSLGRSWALNERINQKGVVLEGGFLFRFNPFVFDIGISSIQIKSLQVTAGIGVLLFKN